MSRTITISDELYARLEADARVRGLSGVESLLEELERKEADVQQREKVVGEINALRERLFAKYGAMPDSVELLREDRSR